MVVDKKELNGLKKTSLSLLNICKIGFTYVGAVIGAGFASGQEIFQFFVRYGERGFWGIFLAAALFIIGGIICLQLAKRLRVNHYYQIFYKLLGRGQGLVVDLIYIIFILGSISVMLAGSGTIFQKALALNYNVGVLLTLLLVIVTIFTGVKGILVINTILIPVLTLVITYTSVNGLSISGQSAMLSCQETVFPWYLSAIMYVAFNVFMSLAIMSVIGTEKRNQKVLIAGGILGGGLLGLILLLMGGVMFLHGSEIQNLEMPMLKIVDLFQPELYFVYMIGMWFAMITTAVAHTYAFVQRIMPLSKLSYYNSTMLTIIVVLPLTRFGFANLVKFLYPVYGIVTLIVLIFLWFGWQKMK